MVKWKQVGLFREIFPGEQSFPSMIPFLGTVPQEDEALITAYLKNGRGTEASSRIVVDAFDVSKKIGLLAIQTDDVWNWPNVLAYYVETYHCRLPEEFVEHMRKRGWRSGT
jgi:hypothetical protein